MTNEEKFVNELIGYIFAYPDDDYMTMECLCRKLHKYGLIEKKDGEWTTDFIEHKTEPSNSEIPNNSTISKMEQVEDEPQTETEIARAIVHKMIDDAVLAEDAYPDLRQKMHDAVDEYEPQTDCPKSCPSIDICTKDDTDCPWR